MRPLTRMVVWFVPILIWVGPVEATEDHTDTIEKILKGVELRYAGKGFRAKFFQESFLKAMQISDTAEGHLTVQRPGRMRWEYVLPEKQIIITDGQSLWIYRPDDKQVMVGKAPDFFGGGKGAGFLSDIRELRKSFTVQLQTEQSAKYHRLRLVPKKPTPDLADMVLSVAKFNYQVDQVITHNRYGDETMIVLNNYQFNLNPKDDLFRFVIPEGVDVVQIDQP